MAATKHTSEPAAHRGEALPAESMPVDNKADDTLVERAKRLEEKNAKHLAAMVAEHGTQPSEGGVYKRVGGKLHRVSKE